MINVTFFRASYHFKDDLTSKEQIHNDVKEEEEKK